jgi:hypothetical protein
MVWFRALRFQINRIMAGYLRQRVRHINYYRRHPQEVQARWWQTLTETGRWTQYGRIFNMQEIRHYRDFSERLPIVQYDDLKPYIERSMYGERDVLWPGQTRWFAKSSGTTSDKSKFIPVTRDNLRTCHIKGTWDTMSIYYQHNPQAPLFALKSLLMGGSLQSFPEYPATRYGDISAIMIEHMPFIGRPFFTPDLATALMSEWEAKIERMARITSREKDMAMIGGVPTWTVMLIRRILELTGAADMSAIWPHLQVYIHGGVSFSPYRETFRQFFPQGIDYQEIYNATEGFFGVQEHLDRPDLLLLLDNGIFYEFLPMEEWDKPEPRAIPLEDVQPGVHYAPVITTNAGLWRYVPGDTIRFTDIRPYRFRVTGRTRQFINAFGEEVMIANTDEALAQTCREFDTVVSEYTVAPCFLGATGKGGHQWLIEFEKSPRDLHRFADVLDRNLQRLNSDYEAKRYRDIALDNLRLTALPNGTFMNWMRRKGKLGGQYKVPRLSNSRQYVEELLQLVEYNRSAG